MTTANYEQIQKIKKKFIDFLNLTNYKPIPLMRYSDYGIWWESDKKGGLSRLYVQIFDNTDHPVLYGYFDVKTSYRFNPSRCVYDQFQFFCFFEEHACVIDCDKIYANIKNTSDLIIWVQEYEIF